MDESLKEDQSHSHNNIDDIEMISLSDENLADMLITKYDYLDSCIANEKFDAQLCSNLVLLLKFILENGHHMDDDANHREQMNMFFTLFRNILRNHLKCLPDSINLLILRLIEIRASKWKIKSSIEEYYMKKVDKLQSNNNMFRPNNYRSYNEKSSGYSNIRISKSYSDVINANNNADGSPPKNSKLLKMNAKGVYKDEVSIKNSDSGKVMGIKGRRIHMIEEMSDTIISFQKVSPTAKERLVLISGYNRESIEKAKNLIDVTIRQNISPIPFESHETSNFNVTLSSIKTTADPIEEAQFLYCSSSNELNIENSKKNSSNSNNSGKNNASSDTTDIFSYSFSFNFNNKNIQIKISDSIIGKKLEHFLNKFNFINFLINENFDNHDKEISKSSCDQKKTIITYDRDFLMSLRESHMNFDDSRLMNDIKEKQASLLR
ncbi:hypothetical protein HUG17_5415 [Dermatophagoides farinae]|uniref:K Homology domain-containing protein n=1 Tax=Dermatophagoides farinae TaxID=6954 RepID=A0A9D4SID6_DERFA|nr:eukaryotic translation initiation factor 4E-binding protein Mextli-like [Dermatophagoides farinae]KAH7642370.1 hypothetical protein HUG17_5415 [Dermatophagoides farinae]